MLHCCHAGAHSQFGSSMYVSIQDWRLRIAMRVAYVQIYLEFRIIHGIDQLQQDARLPLKHILHMD